MNILYSFNKKPEEASLIAAEFECFSGNQSQFNVKPFCHSSVAPTVLYKTAHLLDYAYHNKNPHLFNLYAKIAEYINGSSIDVLYVTNANPYHPLFLKQLSCKCVYQTTDDPGSTFLRNTPYANAFDHVFYINYQYDKEYTMKEFMSAVGNVNSSFSPLGYFNFECGYHEYDFEQLWNQKEESIVYVGSFWRQKMSTLLRLKQHFGNKFQIYGNWRLKHSVYASAKLKQPIKVRRVGLQEKAMLYAKAKIGVNIHWNEYGVGNQRLFQLAANGVCQLTDGGAILEQYYDSESILTYCSPEDAIEQISHLLDNLDIAKSIAHKSYIYCRKEYYTPSLICKALSEYI
jgi:hypothetical protein